MPTKVSTKRKPKNFAGAGALISGGIQVGGMLLNHVIEKKKLEKAAAAEAEANTNAINLNQKNDADAYNTYLSQHPELLYGSQKEIQALGEGEMNIAGPNNLVVAGSHESGNDLERAGDYVEGGEVTRGSQVDSNRIEMFTPAQVNAGWSVILDEVSKIANKSTGTIKGQLTRAVDKIQDKIHKVNQAQEAMKDDYGFTINKDGSMDNSSSSPTGVQPSDKPRMFIGTDGNPVLFERGAPEEKDKFGQFFDSFFQPKAAGNVDFEPSDLPTPFSLDPNDPANQIALDAGEGGGLGSINSSLVTAGIDAGVNVLDNVLNAQLLKQVPKIPRPQYYSKANLQTDIDVSDQITDVVGDRDALDKFVDASTASSATAIQRKRANRTDAAKKIARIRGEESRIETQLENQKALSDQRVKNINADLNTQFDRERVARENQILSAKSQNVSNLSRDFSDVLDKYRAGEFQKEQLLNDALKYQDSGVVITTALNTGAFDGESRANKQKLIDMARAAGRDAQAAQLEAKWGFTN